MARRLAGRHFVSPLGAASHAREKEKPLEPIEPVVSTDHLYVCSGSGGLFGPFAFDAGPPTHEQRCHAKDDAYRQEPWHQRRTDLPEAIDDSPVVLSLCLCCASTLIASGSKFSSFFCHDCDASAKELRDIAGFPLIPLGRHSLTNGLGLTGATAADPDKVAAFVSASKELFARIDRLDVWRRGVVADFVDAISPGASHVHAAAYLAFTAQQAPPKTELFRQLCRYFGVDAEALRRPASHEQEES